LNPSSTRLCRKITMSSQLFVDKVCCAIRVFIVSFDTRPQIHNTFESYSTTVVLCACTSSARVYYIVDDTPRTTAYYSTRRNGRHLLPNTKSLAECAVFTARKSNHIEANSLSEVFFKFFTPRTFQ